MVELVAVRTQENEAYLAAKKDDEDAAVLVHDATAVLEDFYSTNGLMLAQQKKQPGQAPIAPPATWDKPEYGGKTMEATGIISILKMIKEDIEKDIAKADADETEAIRIFDAAKSKLATERGELIMLLTQLRKTKGEKESKHSETQTTRTLTKGRLDIVMKKIKDAEPGCNYFTIKYPLRLKDRQIETDGLLKAKAVLSGANFAKPEDPNREIRPGDAFAQVRKHI